ncbi:MAG TPA: glycosyltransferase [Terracidiphilus sp.]|nr:glycosyltransferase [Terracidiphilus sp.]
MRLLHVIRGTDPESGGPIEALLRISEVLMRDGHHVEAVSLEPEDVVARRNFPFPLKGLGNGIGRYHYNSALKPWLREAAERFDAVVLHGLWNYTSLGSWRALKGHKTPYFLFVHGMMDPWFRERYPAKHLAKQIFWTLGEGRVLRDAKAVLFTCEEERLRARNEFRGHGYKERVVLFGTADPQGSVQAEESAFRRAASGLQGRRFLLFLSRIHPKKGCDLLVRAFASLVPQLPTDLDLVMAGPDSKGWAASLQATAAQLGVSRRIHWVGMLRGEAKWGALRSADALILPSHQENFGIVVAEAMACSTPVLISDQVNIWREIETAKSGLVEPDTEEGTARLIRRFCAMEPEDRARMRVAAREGFLQHFDIESSARDFARAIGFDAEAQPARASLIVS